MSNLSLNCIKKRVEEARADLQYEKPTMKGFYNDLIKIKANLEELYDRDLFYLGYILDDAPYHGWTGENLKGMRQIDQDIQAKFYELYAILVEATKEDIK